MCMGLIIKLWIYNIAQQSKKKFCMKLIFSFVHTAYKSASVLPGTYEHLFSAQSIHTVSVFVYGFKPEVGVT